MRIMSESFNQIDAYYFILVEETNHSNTIEKKNALAAEIKVEHIQEKIYEYRNNALRITIKNGITSQKNENVKLNYCDL
ncbi:hypothetical protein POVCU1_076560 [Plasmodium ovale curtisi]|uniref:Uncharacterized protein n=1 Tax=Plasmodium ovale curtisi TaxID=864141 RepID=A0A1A8XAX1_PLAOA|nr:hypothetical protein POVCU1_076560 [Plasmodium ovale curtisi]